MRRETGMTTPTSPNKPQIPVSSRYLENPSDAVIPHVPWEDVHSRVGDFWIPGDAPHHSIVAQTRGGKSYLIGNGILKHKEHERILIIDVKGDDPTYAEIGR